MMPRLDGPGLCRQIRSRPDGAYVYIMLLTAKESHADIVAGLEAGADDYVTKPCRPAELMARLHTGRRILQLEDKLVEASEQMRFKATHDALTLLWNRGAILNILKTPLVKQTHESFPLSLILCDIDHFKKINDMHGHLAGDEVLREFSVRLTGGVRDSDAVGRYGGEEFLVVLPRCSRQQVAEVAEDLRKSTARRPFATNSGLLPVTLSAGATTIEHWEEVISIEQSLNDADTALYRAKRSGRNQVVIAEPENEVLSALDPAACRALLPPVAEPKRKLTLQLA
jgi:two-component system cell cycle response regulator